MSDSNKDKPLSVDEYLGANNCSEIELRQKILNAEVYVLAWVDGLFALMHTPIYKVPLPSGNSDVGTICQRRGYRKLAGLIYVDSSVILEALSGAAPLTERIFISNTISHSPPSRHDCIDDPRLTYANYSHIDILTQQIEKGELSKLYDRLFLTVTGEQFPRMYNDSRGGGGKASDSELYSDLSEKFLLKLEDYKYEFTSTTDWIVQPCNHLKMTGTISSYLDSRGVNLETLRYSNRSCRGTHTGLKDMDSSFMSRRIVEEDDFLIQRKDLYIVDNSDTFNAYFDLSKNITKNDELDEDLSEKNSHTEFIDIAQEIQGIFWTMQILDLLYNFHFLI